MGIDITPGFNLGISDAVKKVTNAASSFKGSGGNRVVFSNPTGQSNKPTSTAKPTKTVTNKNKAQPKEPQYESTTGSGSSSGNGGSGSASAADIALIDAGINTSNNSLGLLDRQAEIGRENINNGFSSAINRLLGERAIAERNYKTNKDDTTNDNVEARNEINANVGRTANAAKRLLGQHGSGNSSAAKIVAPYGAALQGTEQLRGVTDAFGRNMRDLDTSMTDYTTAWDGSKKDVEDQKFQSEQSLNADIATKRASILSNVATLLAQKAAAGGANGATALAAAQPYLERANAAQAEATGFGKQYASPITVKAPTYAAPELASYNHDAGAAPAVENTSAYTDTISPALSILLGRKTKQAMAQ